MVVTYSPTFAIDDLDLYDSFNRSLGRFNTVQVEDEQLTSDDLATYYAVETNWMTRPPAMVYRDGLLVTSGTTLSLPSGFVTFSTVQAPSAVITASFSFNPYGASDLSGLLLDGLYGLEGLASYTFDPTAIPRQFRIAVIAQASILGIQGLMAQTAEYYRYSIDGREVDKNGVTAHYDKILARLAKTLAVTMQWLRLGTMARGKTVPLNIDLHLPPTPWSTYPVPPGGDP